MFQYLCMCIAWLGQQSMTNGNGSGTLQTNMCVNCVYVPVHAYSQIYVCNLLDDL